MNNTVLEILKVTKFIENEFGQKLDWDIKFDDMDHVIIMTSDIPNSVINRVHSNSILGKNNMEWDIGEYIITYFSTANFEQGYNDDRDGNDYISIEIEPKTEYMVSQIKSYLNIKSVNMME